MAVAAHDERDFEFAKKYSLPVTQVVQKIGGETVLPFTEDGILVNSGEFDGLSGEEARNAIAAKLTKTGKGSKRSTIACAIGRYPANATGARRFP